MRLFVLLICATTSLAALLGIDFGHDFTKATLVAPGMPFEIVMSADSKRKDVSGLALKPLGEDIERLYGSQTTSQCTRFPKQCVMNYKPLLGKPADDTVVHHYLQSHPGVQITPSNNNRSSISFTVEGKKYPVEEILAMNIKNIVNSASKLLKEDSPGIAARIDNVAITVPAFFSVSQRIAIMDAAELAGLNVVALVDDGLAIATNYASNREFDVGVKEYHVIYDMGAGSTKATLVSFHKNDTVSPLQIEVEGYAYDDVLGGAHLTNGVAELIKAKFLEAHPEIRNANFQANERAVAKLYQTAEKAKLVLSANNEAPISIESFFDDIDFKTKISREEFEDFISDISVRVTAPLLDSLKGAGVSVKELTSVIYAGGSTRVPFVQRHLLSLIGEDLVSKTINADEAAVFGAALRGIQISKIFRAKEFNVTEQSLYNYRVSFDDESAVIVFPKGTAYGSSFELDVTDKFTGDEVFGFDVIEDAKRYVRYEAGAPSDIIENLKLNVTLCTGDVKYIASFELNESRLFGLKSLKAQCSSDSVDSTKTISEAIPSKQKFLGCRPLGSVTRQDLKNHLLMLDTKDKQRKLIAEKLNQLEAVIYDARGYLSDDNTVERQVPEEMIERANDLISGYLEWLDFESDGATLKEIKSKTAAVKDIKGEIVKYIARLSMPLDLSAFQAVQKNAVKATNKFQEALLTIREENMNITVAFEEIGLDFEEEFSKLKVPDLLSESLFEKMKGDLDAVMTLVQELAILDEDALEKIPREEKLATMLSVNDELKKLEKLTRDIEMKYAKTKKSLMDVYGKKVRALKRAAMKELKKKQDEVEKEKEAEKQEEEEEEEEEEEQVHEESTQYTHDEL